MVSLLRTLRYGLTILAVGTCLIGYALPPAQADPIMRTVVLAASLQGVPVGELTVDLTGEDKNGNNLIDVADPDAELTDLSAHWVPVDDTGQPAFTATLSDGVDGLALQYNLTTDTLLALLIDGTASGDSVLIDCQEGCDVDNLLIIQSPVKDSFSSYIVTSQQVSAPTLVPEPSTWCLFATGLLGLLGYTYARRQRDALVTTPRLRG